MQKTQKEILSLIGILLMIFAGMILYSLITGKFQICLFRVFTGLPCPGCGLTRALYFLLQGDWKRSLAFHFLLLPLLFTLFTAFMAYIGSKKKNHRSNAEKKFFSFFMKLHSSKYFYTGIFLLLLLYYSCRMIIFFPAGAEPMTYEKASLAGKIYTVLFEK